MENETLSESTWESEGICREFLQTWRRETGWRRSGGQWCLYEIKLNPVQSVPTPVPEQCVQGCAGMMMPSALKATG